MTDNVNICHELLHFIKQRKGTKGAIVIKLDLEKACDRMEWNFIKKMLLDVGLPNNLIDIIMICITTGC